MGNLEFATQNVTRLLRLANSSTTWVSNTQTPVQIVQAGYLRDLVILATGSQVTTTTAITLADSWAPWGVIGNYQVNSNVQAGIINLSGIATHWVDDILMGLEQNSNTLDATLFAGTSLGGTAGIPTGYVTSESGSLYSVVLTATTQPLTLPWWIPLAQKINTLDGWVGIWDLQDPSIQMVLNYTPQTSSTVSPFNVVEGTVATGAGLFVQAANTSVWTTPTMLISRIMYDPPVDPRNDPDFGFVHSWYEETFNTGLAGSKVVNWRALANSGYITRLIWGIWDSTPATGVADSNLTSANALNFTVGNNAPVYVETIQESRFRASIELGHQLALGVNYLDFLGPDLTMQNVLDTFTAGNINLQINTGSPLGATSVGKVVRGMLQALQQ
jgi:hypothetical protein